MPSQVEWRFRRKEDASRIRSKPSETAVSSLPVVTPISRPCDETLRLMRGALARRGLRVLETFDLQDARLGAEDCTCPNHGTADCDCQMVVLMVYGRAGAPVTLMLHGNAQQTWLSIFDDPAHEGDAAIGAVLEDAIRDTQAAEGL